MSRIDGLGVRQRERMPTRQERPSQLIRLGGREFSPFLLPHSICSCLLRVVNVMPSIVLLLIGSIEGGGGVVWRPAPFIGYSAVAEATTAPPIPDVLRSSHPREHCIDDVCTPGMGGGQTPFGWPSTLAKGSHTAH